MDIRLYTLRYKSARIQGVVQAFIEVAAQADETAEFAEAEAKGKWWCMQEPNRRYIGVECAVRVKLDDGPGTKVIDPTIPKPRAETPDPKLAPSPDPKRATARV